MGNVKHVILQDHKNCCWVRFLVLLLLFHLCIKIELVVATNLFVSYGVHKKLSQSGNFQYL
jgi:hypothetical protein